jgi:hypothetical protein
LSNESTDADFELDWHEDGERLEEVDVADVSSNVRKLLVPTLLVSSFKDVSRLVDLDVKCCDPDVPECTPELLVE